MSQLNLHEAKAKLSECSVTALRGERVVIARRNVPAVGLAPIPQRTDEPRKLGQGPKQSGYALPDSFWDPLPDDLIAVLSGARDAVQLSSGSDARARRERAERAERAG